MPRAHRLAPLASLIAFALSAAACGGAVPPAKAPPAPPPPVAVQPTVISRTTEGTPRELFARGEAALTKQQWKDAVDAFETLLAAEPDGASTPTVLLDLGLAYEGLEQREKARDTYHELARRYPQSPAARTALVNAAEIHAYLEEWPQLAATANDLLARKDVDAVDRMTALGARGLAEVEAGQLDAAARDIENGLDLVEENHYGALNRLPVPAAQLEFALGELRRARSEKVALTANDGQVTSDFLLKIEMRCAGLLSAQNAYADAIRSVDPHWAAMSGYRVGEMYSVLHHELMSIPPVEQAKTERQKQLHYGMMHVRYRVLLEKGLEMMRRTLALGEKTQDSSIWMKRAEEAKGEMELALEDEKAQIAKLPFSEEELQKALEILEKRTLGKTGKSGNGASSGNSAAPATAKRERGERAAAAPKADEAHGADDTSGRGAGGSAGRAGGAAGKPTGATATANGEPRPTNAAPTNAASTNAAK